MAASKAAKIMAVLGKSGMGKSYRSKALVKSLGGKWIVIDTMGEWSGPGITRVSSIKAVIAELKGKAKIIAFQPTASPSLAERQFEKVCEIVFKVGGVGLFVEELSRYTKPARAPYWWRCITGQGRHQGLRVIATSQRPAQIDKDFLGNTTDIYAFCFRYEEDAKSVAAAMPGQDWRQLQKLRAQHFVHFCDEVNAPVLCGPNGKPVT